MEQQLTHHPVRGSPRLTDSTQTDSNMGSNITWTNKKHNSYLDDLEASFVDQLQNSLVSEKKRSVDADCPPDQFTVLQGGFWQKKTFEKDSLFPYNEAASHVAMKKSRLCNLLNSGKLGNRNSMGSPGKIIIKSEMPLLGEKRLLTSSESSFPCHTGNEDAAGALAEGSDQNFVNEDQIEKTNGNFSSSRRVKKSVSHAPPEEQIVPSNPF